MLRSRVRPSFFNPILERKFNELQKSNESTTAEKSSSVNSNAAKRAKTKDAEPTRIYEL